VRTQIAAINPASTDIARSEDARVDGIEVLKEIKADEPYQAHPRGRDDLVSRGKRYCEKL